MGNAPHVSTWCRPTPEKRQTVYCYQSLSGEDMDYSTIYSSKAPGRKSKLPKRQNKQNVEDLHKKIDQLNRKLNSMKSQLASELVQKLKESEDVNNLRSVAISRYVNEGKETKNTLTTKASKYTGSRHWGGNSIIERYQH